MRPDALRLALVIIFSALIGVLVDHIALCIISGMVFYILWQYRALTKILAFLRHAGDDNLPDLPGITNEIMREIDFLRAHHRQREEKLARYLDQFQEATEAAPDAFIVFDEQGKIEWSNIKAKDYLGINWPGDVGQRISNLARYPDFADYLCALEEGPKSTPMIVIRSPVKEALVLEVRVKTYGDRRRLLIARDITDVQRTNNMRKDFIANASHELRTPLTVISGYLEAFDGDLDMCPPSWRPLITQMRNQSTRMQRLIDDLLKLSRLESRTDTEPDVEIRVADMLSALHKEAELYSGIMEHVFYLDVQPALWLKGNQADIYSAFSNLVFNAVQYTPQKGVIRIRWYGDNSGAHFEVSDTGEGIAAEHIPRITERFYRADKGRSREKGGTGLGLAIVRHVIVQHDAQMHINSEPGKGTTVTCHFPKQRLINLEPPVSVSLTA